MYIRIGVNEKIFTEISNFNKASFQDFLLELISIRITIMNSSLISDKFNEALAHAFSIIIRNAITKIP
jgi:hypothetical protein